MNEIKINFISLLYAVLLYFSGSKPRSPLLSVHQNSCWTPSHQFNSNTIGDWGFLETYPPILYNNSQAIAIVIATAGNPES